MRAELRRLTAALLPADPKAIMACIGKLMIHFPMTNMTEREKTLLLEDYLDDLGTYPAWAIAEACHDYRRDPSNQFFPKVAILTAMAARNCTEMRRLKLCIERILQGPKEEAPASPVAEVARQLSSTPRPLPTGPKPLTNEERVENTIRAMRDMGAKEEDIQEFARQSGVAA